MPLRLSIPNCSVVTVPLLGSARVESRVRRQKQLCNILKLGALDSQLISQSVLVLYPCFTIDVL